MFSCIVGLVNPGEEVIVFDPSYDCYRPQVQIAGGKTIGIPLKPKKSVLNLSIIAYQARYNKKNRKRSGIFGGRLMGNRFLTILKITKL